LLVVVGSLVGVVVKMAVIIGLRRKQKQPFS
jgi:hypothetical protein